MQKYKSKKKEYDWFMFDSMVECDYYKFLKEKEELWLVKNIIVQPKYLLQEKFIKNNKKNRAIWYIADFEVIYKKWNIIVVDIKWMATTEAKIKRKLFDYKFPDKELQWIVRYGWEFVQYDDNEKRKQKNKKEKKGRILKNE